MSSDTEDDEERPPSGNPRRPMQLPKPKKRCRVCVNNVSRVGKEDLGAGGMRSLDGKVHPKAPQVYAIAWHSDAQLNRKGKHNKDKLEPVGQENNN